MPKLIFTSHYLRDAPPEHLENYVRYIGTREGVEKIGESKLSLPATGNQKELIAQLIRDIPQTKELLEYADFLFFLISCPSFTATDMDWQSFSLWAEVL